MYLKSLTLKGFKSFADRTVMAFDPGLTVVVGPNGSGKSNVSDAILWVLGEQSSKMLRGQAMEDMIFSGSSARKPVGVAEVTLVLDNSDHVLPVDFEEVGITRRMYRSGESEYLINSSPARLRDVQDILHDSGLGKDVHSIIGQGKLDDVLQSRPETRRELIEEAADIAKHRRRKERAERRMASMGENLVRAKDISREVHRQLRPLERQVDRAKRANEISERLAYESCVLAVDDLRRLQAAHAELTRRDQEAQAAVELARYRSQEKARELDKLQALLEQKGLFVGDLGEQRRRTQQILARIESDMRLLEEKGKNMVGRISELRMELSASAKRRADAASQLEQARSELAQAKAEAGELEEETGRLGPEADAAKRRRSELDACHAKAASELSQALKTADAEALAHARLRDAVSKAEVEDSLFESRIAQLEEGAQAAQKAAEEGEARAEELAGRLDEARAAERAATEAVERGTAALTRARAEEDSARTALADARAQLSALVRMDEMASKASPLMGELAQREDVAAHVSCRLGDLIEAPTALEGPVERLLGADLLALVVDAPDELANVARTAASRASVGGTASMLSLGDAELAGAVAGEDAGGCEQAPGTRLLDEVSVDERAVPLFGALLGDVRVVDDVDAALAAHAASPSHAYVTLDGATVYPDGRVHVGEDVSEGTGSLERKRRIRSLERGMAGMERASKEASEAASAAQEALSEARSKVAAAQGTAARISGERESVAKEAARQRERLAKAAEERRKVERRREKAAKTLEESRPELERHARAAEEAQARAASLTHDMDAMAPDRDEAAKAEQATSERLSEARLRLASTRERARYLETRASELSRRIEELDGRIAEAGRSARALEVMVQRVSPLHERYDAMSEAATAWAARLRDRASLAESDSDSLKRTIGEARKQAAEAGEAVDAAVEEANAVKVEIGRVEVQVEQAVQGIRALGAMELEDALRLEAPEDRDALKEEVASLRRSLADIGPVNQVAMGEYQRLSERADYIDEQVADLEAAQKALSRISAAIDRKMRNRFLATFDKVNGNFSRIFQILFPGGSAHLELTDPDDPASSGVEVVAQPKGKRITKMSLMSGGERSLTALALLFAVYQARTVPFYVFDEVEAALDDSNLDRFLNAIDQLREVTQLIVISHQRRTMEKADVLYGVSMRADGVSHVVSQRLDRTTGKVVDA
ncbi:MAG: chromosome segregation protein SMC [Atopobiaceae bacterium]|nr:chromosome segregation protein SMC [Atopobiaceae bacterium]MCH4120477.1 chromosome segregation protein SMC [Atopobiaceae bacterium]MCI1388315.1 chromosome segregation protein SMC [Atopobiaceae bacterium]MCI1431435.1 chromosome segregation protein SMC [Atopobiaceae bacterium]MCI1469871.1 chromosome segregation protein SMC [Atopobiaceae bacterium]